MVKLLESEVLSRDVLDWTGLHLFHATLSSCSQKTRIFLAEKGLNWESHPVDLMGNENLTEFYLGINPRGLVPVLVDNGEVHIESNDIVLHLEEKFPEPRLIPDNSTSEVSALLDEEDDLHLAIRNVTFRFIVEPPKAPKSQEDLERYARFGSSTVGGREDKQKAKEIAYWSNYGESRVLDEDARASVSALRAALGRLDDRLSQSTYLAGQTLSIADIAWFVMANRMQIAGYPLARLHPRVMAWYGRLGKRPHWAEETAAPDLFRGMVEQHQARLAGEGRRLVDICDLADPMGAA